MLFTLRTTHNHVLFHLTGAIGRNGKTYLSALDLACLLQIKNAYGWAEAVASCKLGEVESDGCGSDSFLVNAWVVELHSLLLVLNACGSQSVLRASPSPLCRPNRDASFTEAEAEATASAASHLLRAIQNGHARVAGQGDCGGGEEEEAADRNHHVLLEECTPHEGRPFRTWLSDFRCQVLQIPQWLVNLGLC